MLRSTRWTALLAAAVFAIGLSLTACTSDGGDAADDVVTVNGGEPQHPLVPTNTNENQGGRVVDRLFAGLKYYDTEGVAHNEVAQSIESTDRQHYRITLAPDWKFTDGSPVTAKSFVDAWNYGALSTNAQLQSWIFASIVGYDEVSVDPPKAQTMSGLKVVDDRTFTVDLTRPSIDFELSLGFTPFRPLPEVAYRDMKAFGERPIGNGPYKFAGPDAWQHNVQIDLVPNPDYRGKRPAKNKGLRFVMYATYDTAYADLLAGNLDLLDTIPDNALTSFKNDLGDRAIQKKTARYEHIGFQPTVPHFGGAEGVLRRKAISLAINRPQIAETIWHGTKAPARDFTSASLPGYQDNLPGVELLTYNPDEARKLWEQANAIAPWTGRLEIAYNSDGGHQAWIEAVANSVKNTLGIEAIGTPYPTFKPLRDAITSKSIRTAFRNAWQGDYPTMLNFLIPQYLSDSASNDIGYVNPEFDKLIAVALAAPTPEESYAHIAKAQAILFQDMPDVPVFNDNNNAGHSDKVREAKLTWNGLFAYESVEK
ncbi:peptide ABC transporter substrate-binding protein [Nocardia iowensis]|uniref:ABC transporter substrate-binding protein n=1 Tax=Nocardia iowensis TaxID=204891 RepID=A0ABX8RKC2_NOCIO|nr:ABC transporter substrate-binding protein [Nocardia iowensis]QXN90093.1 ABC transporter substrate-binding protein [Nocardia iowensis]